MNRKERVVWSSLPIGADRCTPLNWEGQSQLSAQGILISAPSFLHQKIFFFGKKVGVFVVVVIYFGFVLLCFVFLNIKPLSSGNTVS